MNHRKSRVSVSFLAILLVAFVHLSACIDLHHEEYQFVGHLLPDEMAPLASPTREGLNRLGTGIFKVESVEMIAGTKMKVVDGFLYERDLEIVDVWADLRFVESYKVRSADEIKNAVGDAGWSMAASSRARDLGGLLRKDWSGADKDRGRLARVSQDFADAVSKLFGDVGQEFANGMIKSDDRTGRQWHVTVPLNFRGREAILLGAAPRIDESDRGWLTSSDLVVLLWSQEEGRLKNNVESFSPADRTILAQIKKNFEASFSDMSEDSAASRYRRARSRYEDAFGGQAIKKGRRWKAKATAIFDRDGDARILHHVGGAWNVGVEPRRRDHR